MAALRRTPRTAHAFAFAAAAGALAVLLPWPGPRAAADEGEGAGVLAKSPADVQAELLAEHTSVKPGGRASLALRLVVSPGWHVYWRNAGDAGLPPKATWTLPEGWRAGPLVFPVPTRHEEGPIVTFIHEGEVLLPVEIEAPSNAKAGTDVAIAVDVESLVCSDVCVPVKRTARATLRIAGGEPAADEKRRETFAAMRRALPMAPPSGPAKAARKGDDVVLDLTGTGVPLDADARVEFFPSDDGVVTLAPARREKACVLLAARPAPARAEAPAGEKAGVAAEERLRGVLAVATKSGRRGYEIDVAVAGPAADGSTQDTKETR